MTIAKIKNPVLRWFVGLVIVAAMIVAATIIFYAIGCIAGKICPRIFYYFGDEGFFLTTIDGVGVIAILFCSFCIGLLIWAGAEALGEKFFDP